LSERRSETKRPHLQQSIIVHRILDLSYPDLVFIIVSSVLVLAELLYAALILALHQVVVLALERIIEADVTIDALYDIILNQYQSVDLDVNRKPVCVEARADLLVYLDEYVICRLFYRPLAVLLRH